MPKRWFHEAIDIIVWGRSYWRLHQAKDAPSQNLGPGHRIVRHPWYQRFGKDWNHEDPFPEAVLMKTQRVKENHGPKQAETFQASVTHDYFDRLWDEFPAEDRKEVAEAFRQILLDPEFLRNWAGVDVVDGLVKVRYGRTEGHLFEFDRWEREPMLARDYKKLRAYVETKSIDELI